MLLCDMHIHSNCSDGSFAPEELIKIAYEAGLGAVALCDHNTVRGLSRFEAAAQDSEIAAVPGVEITSEYGGKEVHILGLFIKPEYREVLSQYLEVINLRKEESNRALADRLSLGGYDIDYEKIKSKTDAKVPNRVHFAKELTELGYVSSIAEAFEKLLRDGGDFYRSAEKLNSLDVIKFLSSVEAVPIMAHPLVSLTADELCEFLPRAKECGLAGIEAIYTAFDDEETELLTELAEKFGLTVSGGSDFHGKNRPGVKLGRGTDNIIIPYEIYENLKKSTRKLHKMRLKKDPFEAMACGRKTIELRLCDEKRSKIRVGDVIEFECNDDPAKKLTATVTALHPFSSFKELYAALPLEKCGYKESELATASYLDMENYYSREEQESSGVLGIEIKPE